MRWSGQHIYDLVSKFRGTNGSSVTIDSNSTSPLVIYQPVVNASPRIVIGSSDTENLTIRSFYQSGTQEMQVASFATNTAETDVDRGKFQFTVDGSNIVAFLDDGIDLFTGKGISINGTDILTDSSGTATLSNIDAIDATTIATFEAAIESNIDTITNDLTISTTGTQLKLAHNANDYATFTVADTGDLTIATVGDGSRDSDLTLDADGQIKLEPASGANILLDGTIAVDAGVVTGATSITSTTFVGDVTGDVTGDLTGTAQAVSTIAGLAPNTATTQATQPNIDSIGTDGDTLNILGDTVLLSNTTSGMPTFSLYNRTNDASGPFIYMANTRLVGDNAVDSSDGDLLGTIIFRGYDDGTPGIQDYAKIYSDIHDATSGEESGRLTLQVANHDGGLGSGLILTGGSADNEIDITLGLGAASVVTIPGDIDLAGDIDVDGTLETDALTIGGTTVAAVGTTSITTLGTIGTGVWNGTAIASAYIADDAVTFAKAVGVSPNVYGSIIKLLPSDFAANIDGGNTKLGVGYTDTAGSAYGMKVGSANTELFAFVSIPEGMKATHVDVFDKDDRALEVFEVQINATSLTSKGSGNCNTTLDITDVNATATNFLAIKITTTATTDKVFGGQVTIAAQ
tara:strand:+ start:947 stop:2836 length:1890 start_codon:yes stop_codon:yes gene_type:complete